MFGLAGDLTEQGKTSAEQMKANIQSQIRETATDFLDNAQQSAANAE